MKADSRLGYLLLAGAIAFAPVNALAQEAPTTTTDTPATDSIGPRDLQNFSLNGTVTRAAEQPAPVQQQPQRQQTQAQPTPPANEARTATTETAEAPPRAAATPPPRRTETAAADVPSSVQPQRTAESSPQSAPSSSVTLALPKLGSETATGAAAPADFAPEPTTSTLASEHKFPVVPWLLAILALAAGGAFLFWRNRHREAFAGGPQIDAFTAPEPARAPAPAPRPAPAHPAPAPKAPAPASIGIVSTRLRPWIDLGIDPLRCVLDHEKLIVEFELELFNSGSAPARAVLVEASIFNAGPSQDQQVGNFFASPVGQGERIVVIPPLKRLSIKTQVATPREQLQAYELAGRQVFVPVIGFNALYSWSGGEGQTSVSYLLGRDTKGEKMGPFRLDLGPHIFRGIAARLLPSGVRK
jgi:hypothetical protein